MIEKTAFIFYIGSSTKTIDFLYQKRESYYWRCKKVGNLYDAVNATYWDVHTLLINQLVSER